VIFAHIAYFSLLFTVLHRFQSIITTDLPYLLDWSLTTGAVVICPEYGLLPEHTFPDALSQIIDVYQGLRAKENSVFTLGFEVGRIVVTGESAGGNLAAALCVHLGNQGGCNESGDRSESSELDNCQNGIAVQQGVGMERTVMPDALMLSCPVLDLTNEITHSRVLGSNDPVLRGGLISAISDAYIPPRLGVSKKCPLASPIYTYVTRRDEGARFFHFYDFPFFLWFF